MAENELHTNPPSSALRLVLFGMPAAGKSSLLGALSQAARTQEHLLAGRLVDPSERLLELQKALYEDRARETHEEVVVYAVSWEHVAQEGQRPSRPQEVAFFDCDGRVASEYLSRQRDLDDGSGPTALARAVLAADTLILVVDASTEQGRLDQDFARFAEFLRLLESWRGQHSEVGGLPVYLVLTKCDLLAKKTDSAIVWMQRLEERKRQVGQRFQEFLAGQGVHVPAFGWINLHLWATAVRRPPLTDRPAKPQEPYGVAELFRQCLESASAFREQHLRAGRRLKLTVTGVVGLVATMLLLAVGFFFTRPSAEVMALENQLRGVLPVEGAPPAERFRDADDRLKEIVRIRKDADFDKLPPPIQARVDNYVRELETYAAYNKAFLEKVQEPRFATSEEELQRIEKNVTDMPLPEEYQSAWTETRVGQRREQWLQDTKTLRTAAKEAETWFRDQVRKGKQLLQQAGPLLARTADVTERESWFAQTKEFLDQPLPHKESDRPPGATTVTYGTVYHFEPAARARESWKEAKDRLEGARKLILE